MYIIIPLDLPRRVDAAMMMEPVKSSRTSKKTSISSTMYELIPRSCECPMNLASEKANPTGRIQGPWKVEPITKDIAGTVRRVFSCNMFKIEVNLFTQYFCSKI